ncbi:ER-derived vesicles protein erv46 [Yamadazyma tenuis]|uniref:Endoplasmic reticulum-Golgi intermediate compartment protein n=1 Tax=Candida tenuis (strain ATCC 10573 / BCRC 21748 / CBS 615 / JCM 9827 / NBRC 10315 / NRRL Y-1498 / VKM Y-70) TaxID=590646 RepID=G3BAJ4_CANTC|nr:DUF1692-domain-containing protein [Yamadazyma tenuis ATCC 10573]EGV62523.1 DUF1692-domain-containing protein [Yamadazyma tenuis ATCC 10573]WEJ92636.1 ER-derived vesicles protein erv46 [Yamadazyma tenuis]
MVQPKLLSLDAFAKTVEDARVKTASGGIITLVSITIVLFLIRNEYLDYTSIITRPELVVDRDINQKLDITLDISFPSIPCSMINLDILDVSGNVELDILQNGFQKYRILSSGEEVLMKNAPLIDSTPLEVMAKGLDKPEDAEHTPCGDCYGSLPQDRKQYCCNNCETIRRAYAAKVWAFYDGENIKPCEDEGYVKAIQSEIFNNEGCRVKGTTQINRISGNLHFAPGASFTEPSRHVHDLSLYNKFPDRFNFDHTINHLSFGKDPETNANTDKKTLHPLDGETRNLKEKYHLYSYFLKVVSTRYEYLQEKLKAPLETNQFSAIYHDRPIKGGKDEDHQHTLHARGGLPGLYFYFDISPLKIINKEQYSKTWSGFVLGVISSIAGVLMIGSLLDRSVWAAEKAIRAKKDI